MDKSRQYFEEKDQFEQVLQVRERPRGVIYLFRFISRLHELGVRRRWSETPKPRAVGRGGLMPEF